MYEYMYLYVYIDISIHIHANSVTHVDIILVYSMRHLGIFFFTLTLLLGREFLCHCPEEILSYQDLNLQLTFGPSDMIKPRLFNSSPSESFQTLESF